MVSQGAKNIQLTLQMMNDLPPRACPVSQLQTSGLLSPPANIQKIIPVTLWRRVQNNKLGSWHSWHHHDRGRRWVRGRVQLLDIEIFFVYKRIFLKKFPCQEKFAYIYSKHTLIWAACSLWKVPGMQDLMPIFMTIMPMMIKMILGARTIVQVVLNQEVGIVGMKLVGVVGHNNGGRKSTDKFMLRILNFPR